MSSCREGVFLCFQRESLDGEECPVRTEEQKEKAASVGSGAVDHPKRLLTLQFFCNY